MLLHKQMKPYEIRQIKQTATGKRYLVRHNSFGKYTICSSVNEAGTAISNPETTGKFEYVMKKWEKVCGKLIPLT